MLILVVIFNAEIEIKNIRFARKCLSNIKLGDSSWDLILVELTLLHNYAQQSDS